MEIRKINKNKEWLIKKLYGLLYRLENTGDSDFVRGGEASFIKNVSELYADKDFVFFDVGVNKGEYTEMVLNNTHPRRSIGHLFEPQNGCVELLKKKFADNIDITINNYGLSNSDGSVILYKNKEQSSLASIYKRNLDHYKINMDMTETITLKTGTGYMSKNNISKINLMKVDVEGHEMQVFEGFGEFLNPDVIDFIQFEYGGANLDSHSSLMEIHSMLTNKGFLLCKMMRSSLEIRPYNERLENFMYQNWVAVNPKILASI